MDDELGDRVLYLPRGKDSTEDLRRLGETIAASKADLFDNGSGSVVGIDQGQVVGVTPAVLADVITKHVALKVPVNLGTAMQPAWKVTYPPFVPDEETVRALLGIGHRYDQEAVALAQHLPKMPREPLRLTPQQQREVQTRRKSGEPDARIAAAYGVELDEVRRQVAR